MRNIIRMAGSFVKGLGIPTNYSQIIRYIEMGKSWTNNNVTEISIKDCTGGKLIYTNAEDGWWVRYEDNK